MADIRIKDLTTTASSSASDDFVAVDGTTNGTRKLNAYSPSFGGNATVGGTLTVTGFAKTSTHTSLGGSGSVISFSANNNVDTGLPAAWNGNYGIGVQYLGSSSNAFFIGDGSAGSTYFYTRTSSTNTSRLSIDNSTGTVTIPATTDSTTKDTGCLVLEGGLGVEKAVNVGGKGYFTDELWSIGAGKTGILYAANSGDTSYAAFLKGAFADNALLLGVGTTNVLRTAGFSTPTRVEIPLTTASTSTSSGALVVSGGVGVAGAIYAGGKLSLVAGTTSTYGVTFGDIDLYRSGSGILSLTSGTFTGGVGAGFFTINSGGAQPLVFATDATERARVDSSNFTIASGIGLKLGNAYVSGAPTATGYVVIKDSNGTSYKIPAVAL